MSIGGAPINIAPLINEERNDSNFVVEFWENGSVVYSWVRDAACYAQRGGRYDAAPLDMVTGNPVGMPYQVDGVAYTQDTQPLGGSPMGTCFDLAMSTGFIVDYWESSTVDGLPMLFNLACSGAQITCPPALPNSCCAVAA